MALTEQRKESMYRYAKEKLKRIPLDVQKEKYEEIKAAADRAGESVNGYIKTAIEQRMERDSSIAPLPTGKDPKPSQQPVDESVTPCFRESSTKTGKALLTPENISKVDFSRMSDIGYQCELVDSFGSDGFAELYKMAAERQP